MSLSTSLFRGSNIIGISERNVSFVVIQDDVRGWERYAERMLNIPLILNGAIPWLPAAATLYNSEDCDIQPEILDRIS